MEADKSEHVADSDDEPMEIETMAFEDLGLPKEELDEAANILAQYRHKFSRELGCMKMGKIYETVLGGMAAGETAAEPDMSGFFSAMMQPTPQPAQPVEPPPAEKPKPPPPVPSATPSMLPRGLFLPWLETHPPNSQCQSDINGEQTEEQAESQSQSELVISKQHEEETKQATQVDIASEPQPVVEQSQCSEVAQTEVKDMKESHQCSQVVVPTIPVEEQVPEPPKAETQQQCESQTPQQSPAEMSQQPKVETPQSKTEIPQHSDPQTHQKQTAETSLQFESQTSQQSESQTYHRSEKDMAEQPIKEVSSACDDVDPEPGDMLIDSDDEHEYTAFESMALEDIGITRDEMDETEDLLAKYKAMYSVESETVNEPESQSVEQPVSKSHKPHESKTSEQLESNYLQQPESKTSEPPVSKATEQPDLKTPKKPDVKTPEKPESVSLDQPVLPREQSNTETLSQMSEQPEQVVNVDSPTERQILTQSETAQTEQAEKTVDSKTVDDKKIGEVVEASQPEVKVVEASQPKEGEKRRFWMRKEEDEGGEMEEAQRILETYKAMYMKGDSGKAVREEVEEAAGLLVAPREDEIMDPIEQTVIKDQRLSMMTEEEREADYKMRQELEEQKRKEKEAEAAQVWEDEEGMKVLSMLDKVKKDREALQAELYSIKRKKERIGKREMESFQISAKENTDIRRLETLYNERQTMNSRMDTLQTMHHAVSAAIDKEQSLLAKLGVDEEDEQMSVETHRANAKRELQETVQILKEISDLQEKVEKGKDMPAPASGFQEDVPNILKINTAREFEDELALRSTLIRNKIKMITGKTDSKCVLTEADIEETQIVLAAYKKMYHNRMNENDGNNEAIKDVIAELEEAGLMIPPREDEILAPIEQTLIKDKRTAFMTDEEKAADLVRQQKLAEKHEELEAQKREAEGPVWEKDKESDIKKLSVLEQLKLKQQKVLESMKAVKVEMQQTKEYEQRRFESDVAYTDSMEVIWDLGTQRLDMLDEMNEIEQLTTDVEARANRSLESSSDEESSDEEDKEENCTNKTGAEDEVLDTVEYVETVDSETEHDGDSVDGEATKAEQEGKEKKTEIGGCIDGEATKAEQEGKEKKTEIGESIDGDVTKAEQEGKEKKQK